MTLYQETPCEHGQTNSHALPAHQAVGGIDSTCPGGSREEVVIDYKAHVRQNKALNVSDADAKLIVDTALGIT